MSEQKYGPNTAKVEAYLALLPKLTDAQRAAAQTAGVTAWDAARAAGDAAWDAAWVAGRAAEWLTARLAGRAAAGYTASLAASWAAVALVVRDLITQEQFDILTAPMRAAGIDFDALTSKGR